MCRECLLSSLSYTQAKARGDRGEGMCPVCRHLVAKDQILTMPSENRFTVDIKVAGHYTGTLY